MERTPSPPALDRGLVDLHRLIGEARRGRKIALLQGQERAPETSAANA
jgi:hypothetical protein